MRLIRNQKGLTLPFALILCIIFASLVSVSYIFVSINLKQMQGNLQVNQAIVLAEGVNEMIKTRLNTKQLPRLSQDEESKLKDEDSFDDEDEELFDDDDFDESTELFSEYYADEVIKISRYITFRNPPPEEAEEESGIPLLGSGEKEDEIADEEPQEKPKPEDYVATLGNIDIPQGTMLAAGTMLLIYKDVRVNLKQDEITTTNYQQVRDKLPVPTIKSLSPNYAEVGSRSSVTVIGDNLEKSERARFSNKDIEIEDIKTGPVVDFFIKNETMPGTTNFFWDTGKAEFYVVPKYDGSNSPIIDLVLDATGNEFIEANAGARSLELTIAGFDLFLNKSLPVIVPDTAGIKAKIKDQSISGNKISITLSIDKSVDVGVHSFFIATEGGFSNALVFNVLPEDKSSQPSSQQVAIYSSSLSLLEINAVEELLPLIDEEEDDFGDEDDNDDEFADEDDEDDEFADEDDFDDGFDDETAEKDKLGAFANTDLESRWLLETSVMIGKITRTVSEIIERRIPTIRGAVLTNGKIVFNGGSFKILGATTAMTMLVEPTYVSNTLLLVDGPDEEDNEAQPEDPNVQQEVKVQGPAELGFIENSYVAVYRAGANIYELDYGIIDNIEQNTIALISPGLMDFHYEQDDVFQFIPPTITGKKVEPEEAERHLVPKDYALTIPNIVSFRNIFGPNVDQYSELADVFTNDATIPKDDLNLPVGFMGLTYIDTTPVFGEDNNLIGKGVLIVDTRSDNAGNPDGIVEIIGDSRNPAEFNGIVYVKGNLRIDGYVTINGALIVDNDSNDQIEIASNAIGMITYDEKAIKQTILSIPFSSKPGTVMISSKTISLDNVVIAGEDPSEDLGVSGDTKSKTQEPINNESAEESLIQQDAPPAMSSGQENELIKFFD